MAVSRCVNTQGGRIQVRTLVIAKKKGTPQSTNGMACFSVLCNVGKANESAQRANGMACFSAQCNFIGVHDHGLL